MSAGARARLAFETAAAVPGTPWPRPRGNGKKKYWGHRVGWLRLVTAPLVIFVAAFPIITLGIWLVDILHLGPPTWRVTYQAILIGFVAGQVVHRIYAPVGNTVQLFFVEQAI